jgi:hypothetical protein
MTKKLTKEQKNHPFFCHIKNCRKTAWDTPEYLSKNDWIFLEIVYNVMVKKDLDSFLSLQDDREMWRNLFNHMLGWPEGMIYCRGYEYVKKCFMPAVGNNMLPNILKALESHRKESEISP